jgi:hypothetical protein
VTIGKSSEQSRGLLEKQTKSGVVAIRMLEGASCEEIADGIALSLALANTPEPARAAPAVSPAPSITSEPATNPVMDTKSAAPVTPDHPQRPRNFWSIGAQGTTLFGVGPAALFGGAAFVGFTPGTVRPWMPSFRLGGFGGLGNGTTNGHDYDLQLFGARLEGSVWLGWPTVHVNPLAAFDVGAFRAIGHSDTGRSDTGAWLAMSVGLRSEVSISEAVAVEAQLEGITPFTRYHLRSANPPPEAVYSTAALGFALGAGASVRLP